MGENGLLMSKNGWEWIAFLEKWVAVVCFSLKMGGTRSFLSKMGGSRLPFLKNGREWVRVAGSR